MQGWGRGRGRWPCRLSFPGVCRKQNLGQTGAAATAPQGQAELLGEGEVRGSSLRGLSWCVNARTRRPAVSMEHGI